MKLFVLSLITLIGLASTQAEAGFGIRMRPRIGIHVSAPVVYQPVAPCYHCYRPVVYRPMVYQRVVYRPVVRRPHVGFSFGTHGAGISFWA